MDFVSLCRKIIALDSTPAQGNLAVAEWGAELCRDIGLDVELMETSFRGVSQANLVARGGGKGPVVELLLESHLDTVDPGSYSLWTLTDRSPFMATLRDGKIFGLGAAESKLDFLCKWAAIREVGVDRLRKPVALVGTYAEELGLHGARALVKKIGWTAKYALIGEPSGLDLIYASNGSLIVDFSIPFSTEEMELRREHNERESTSSHSRIFHGKAAHSSNPSLGENAIQKMIRYLDDLPEGVLVLSVDGGTAHNVVADQATLEVDLNQVIKAGIRNKLLRLVHEIENVSLDFLKYSAEDFDPPTPTLNLGVIRSNEESVDLVLSMRITPSVNESLLQEWRQRLRKVCDDLGGKMGVRNIVPPARTPKNSAFTMAALEELRSLGQSSRLVTRSASNEASVFGSMGTECLAFGPGRGEGNSHGPNEFNELQHLELATQFYRRMIERYCL